MDRIENELKKRKLPDLVNEKTGKAEWEGRRREIKRILEGFLLGNMPFLEYESVFQMTEKERDAYGGRAELYHMLATVTVYGNPVSFPFQVVLPKGREAKGTFLYLGFTPTIGDGVGECVLEHGYGIVHVFYQDMAADYPDHFQSGLGRLGARNPHQSAGKIAIWAFGLCRVMDYLEQSRLVDIGRVAVMGHSRLGKTALAAGAFDERFSLTAALQSGAGGIAVFRGKKGEQLRDLHREYSREWLCPRAYEYMDDIDALPFDQHFLAALIAPRNLYIGSALRDSWADPLSEYLSCVAVTKAYQRLAHQGLIRKEEMEEVLFRPVEQMEEESGRWGIAGESMEGKIGWHCRYGTHYLSILDWEQVIKYREIHNI